MMRTTRRPFSRRDLFEKPRSIPRSALQVEPMEQRALMAFTSLASFAPVGIAPMVQTRPTITIVTVSQPGRALIQSLEAFLTHLEAAFGRNGTGATALSNKTLQDDLSRIASLSGANNAEAVDRLRRDVTVIADAGTITTPHRQTLLADLRAIALNAGIPGAVVVASANQILGVRNATPGTVATRNDLTEPNALGTSRAGDHRGQGDPATTTTLLPPGPRGSAMPDVGILGAGFRKLLDDMKAGFAGSRAITPAQAFAVRTDFAAVATASHRPDALAVANLRADLNAITAAGKLSDADRAKVRGDLKAMFESAGIRNTLIDRTIADFQPILNAADLDPTALTTVLGDLANVMAARPRSISPIGSWWLGGLPR